MKRAWLSWSSGKDSAWALQRLQQQDDLEVAGLLTTVNADANRVAMHAVRRELLEQQAEALGLPLVVVPLPHPCSNDDYTNAMQAVFADAVADDVHAIAYGDLLLEDVRAWRETLMHGSGLEPLFPLWGADTRELAQQMLASGLQAIVTCVDPRQAPRSVAGQPFDQALLASLPKSVDHCGENGEFHTFAHAGPMFRRPLAFHVGETIERDGFLFTDLRPVAT